MNRPLDHDLDQFPLLAGLEPAARAAAAEALHWSQYRPGEIILNQSDANHDVYFLAQGRLLAVYWAQDGREIIFSAMAEGSYFGELTAIDGAPRSLSVYARTSADLAIMPAEMFRRLIDDSASFRQAILTGLTERVRQLTERNCQLVAYSVPDRVRAFILSRAAEIGRLSPGSILSGFPTHAEIAAQIGANREAVSRAISALAQQAVITTHRGAVTINDPDGLLVEAGQ